MQSTDLGNFDYLAQCGRFDDTAPRGILFKRQMCSVPFVVSEIVSENSAQAEFIEHNEVIQAFAADGADQSLDVGVLPRALWCRENLEYAHGIGSLVELVSITARSRNR